MKINVCLLGLGLLMLSGCAHLPSEGEKTALRSLQHDVKEIESTLYSDKGTGLYERLKYCSLQVHDRINPEVIFDWPEKIEKHVDKDYFTEPDNQPDPATYRVLVNKYKEYKQAALAKKENFERRLKTCDSDLKSVVRREKLRSEQDQKVADAMRGPAPAPGDAQGNDIVASVPKGEGDADAKDSSDSAARAPSYANPNGAGEGDE